MKGYWLILGTKIADPEAQAAYAIAGLPDEWRLHHQGGAAGYEPREYLALPGSQDEVHEGQAFAWNPSITGTKMEDTMLVGEEINEVLTEIPDWPTIPVDIGQVHGAGAKRLRIHGANIKRLAMSANVLVDNDGSAFAGG